MRFIEMMPMYDGGDFTASAYIPYTRVLEKLPDAVPVQQDGGVAKLYRLPGALGNIGLISPVKAHFCGDCNRIRLTADGKVKPCLHSNVEYALKGLDFAGIRGRSLIINLPGSKKASAENLLAVIDPATHGLDMLYSEGSADCGNG